MNAKRWQTSPSGELVAWVEDREAEAFGYCKHDARLLAETRLRSLIEQAGIELASVRIQTRHDPDLRRIEAFVPADLWRGSSSLTVHEGGLLPVERLSIVSTRAR